MSDRDRVDSIDSFRRLACLADVHGNTAALDAVLASEAFSRVDAVAFLGCITTGPDPIGVLQRCAVLKLPTYFLAGNGERAIIELADGATGEPWPTGAWILDRHGPAGLDTIRSWPSGLTGEVVGLGAVRLCHGSPRSDIELLTPHTHPDRIRDATRGITERIIVHGHTHLQYQRTIGDVRIIAPGSVGLPYTDGPFGARWAILGNEVELLTTPYDLGVAEHRVRTSGYPDPRFLRTLQTPPAPADIIADAETRHCSD